MIYNEAKELYLKTYPNHIVLSVLDVGDEWVFSAGDKETNLELDSSPIAVNKETGKMRVFFPPMNMDKLKNAKQLTNI